MEHWMQQLQETYLRMITEATWRDSKGRPQHWAPSWEAKNKYPPGYIQSEEELDASAAYEYEMEQEAEKLGREQDEKENARRNAAAELRARQNKRSAEDRARHKPTGSSFGVPSGPVRGGGTSLPNTYDPLASSGTDTSLPQPQNKNQPDSVQETYIEMIRQRLLSEGGSLNVGTPGQMGEPMQPAMRPMRPGESRREYQEYGDRERKKLKADWDEAEAERKAAIAKTGFAVASPVMAATGLGVAATPAAGILDTALATSFPGVLIGGGHLVALDKSLSPVNPFRGLPSFTFTR